MALAPPVVRSIRNGDPEKASNLLVPTCLSHLLCRDSFLSTLSFKKNISLA